MSPELTAWNVFVKVHLNHTEIFPHRRALRVNELLGALSVAVSPEEFALRRAQNGVAENNVNTHVHRSYLTSGYPRIGTRPRGKQI